MNHSLTRSFSAVGILTALITIATMGQGIARADLPGAHPHYLHARSDLRRAEQLLNTHYELNVTREMREAQQQIREAIHDIDRAAILDRKDIDDNPPIDVSLKDTGRLHEVLRLLDGAHRDLSYEEDNRRDLGWRARGFEHIDQAVRDVRTAIYLHRWDNQFPEFQNGYLARFYRWHP